MTLCTQSTIGHVEAYLIYALRVESKELCFKNLTHVEVFYKMRTFPAIQERHDLALILERFQIFVLLVKKLTEVGHLSHLRPRVDGTELCFKYLDNVELELVRSILGGCNIFDRIFRRNEDFPTLHWEHIYWTQTLVCYRIQNIYRLFIKTDFSLFCIL